MGLFKGIKDTVSGTLNDQWKDIITAGNFDEQTVVAPGLHQSSNNGRGTNNNGSAGVISNGSIIRVPENTAAFIFSQSGIEQVLTKSGEFIYNNGEASIFNGDDVEESLVKNSINRFGFGGQASTETHVAFVNLREIRGIKFGTPGPLMYNDLFYGTDLEIIARGSFSVQVVDAIKFVQSFLPANVAFYSMSNSKAKSQIVPEFMQSFMDALNSLSSEFRISQLPSKSNEIAQTIINDSKNAGSWEGRFGFKIVNVAVETIEFSTESKELVNKYSSSRMNLKAYDEVSQKTSNIMAQQKIAQGIQDNGLGDAAGMAFGINMVQGMNPQNAESNTSKPAMSFDEQIDAVKKLKELLDADILSQEEFDTKKKEIMGL